MKNVTLDKPTTWLLYSIFAYFVMNGAQLWETAIMVPAWTAAPPKSLHFFNGPYGLDFKWFWIIVHSLHEVIFIIAIVLNWKIKSRRAPLAILFTIHVAVRVWTLMYFAPNIIEFQNISPSSDISNELTAKAHEWRNLNYLRVGLFFLVNIALIPVTKRN